MARLRSWSSTAKFGYARLQPLLRCKDDFEERRSRGEAPRALDKQFLRVWLMERGFSGAGEPPTVPDEVRAELTERYLELYRLLASARSSVLHPGPGARTGRARAQRRIAELARNGYAAHALGGAKIARLIAALALAYASNMRTTSLSSKTNSFDWSGSAGRQYS